MENPLTFASTTPLYSSLSRGNSCATTCSTPGFCKPTAFSMPYPPHSAIRGNALPYRASRVVPLNEIPPSTFRSYSAANSSPNPYVPDAGITGFRSSIFDKDTVVFISGQWSVVSCQYSDYSDYSENSDY